MIKKKQNQIWKFFFLITIVLFIFSSCSNNQTETFIYKTLVGNYRISIPTQLNFIKDSISYYKYNNQEYTNEFRIHNPIKSYDYIDVMHDYEWGLDTAKENSIRWEWKSFGFGTFPDSKLLLKKDITINEHEHKYIEAKIFNKEYNGYDEKTDSSNKRLVTTIEFRLDDILFHISVSIFEGDKTYIEILDDIVLLNQIKVSKLN